MEKQQHKETQGCPHFLRSGTNLDVEIVQRAGSIKTRINCEKPQIEVLDALFGKSLEFYSSVLGDDFTNKNHNYKYRLGKSALNNALYMGNGDIVLCSDFVLDDVKYKSLSFELNYGSQSELLKSTIFGLFLHEIFHGIQEGKGLSPKLGINEILKEGGPRFIQDLSLIALMPDLVSKIKDSDPANNLYFDKNKGGYFVGVKNISLLMNLHDEGHKEKFVEEFMGASKAYMHNVRFADYYDDSKLGEIFCTKIYLDCNRDLKDTISRILDLGKVTYPSYDEVTMAAKLIRRLNKKV